jgi:hypothetical protein
VREEPGEESFGFVVERPVVEVAGLLFVEAGEPWVGVGVRLCEWVVVAEAEAGERKAEDLLVEVALRSVVGHFSTMAQS